MKILSIDRKVLFESEHMTLKETLEAAAAARADLTRANLRGANLRGANLRGADLTRAYLREANLREANLREANLTRAYLREANLREADLTRAYLRGADLCGAIGNMTEVFSAHFDRWPCTWLLDGTLQIGCERHSLKKWEKFTDKEINAMDPHALSWWKTWRPVIVSLMLSYRP